MKTHSNQPDRYLLLQSIACSTCIPWKMATLLLIIWVKLSRTIRY